MTEWVRTNGPTTCGAIFRISGKEGSALTNIFVPSFLMNSSIVSIFRSFTIILFLTYGCLLSYAALCFAAAGESCGAVVCYELVPSGCCVEREITITYRYLRSFLWHKQVSWWYNGGVMMLNSNTQYLPCHNNSDTNYVAILRLIISNYYVQVEPPLKMQKQMQKLRNYRFFLLICRINKAASNRR